MAQGMLLGSGRHPSNVSVMKPIQAPRDQRSVMRTAEWFVRTYLLRQDLLTTRIDPPGITVTGYSRDLMGRHVYKRKTYETELSAFILEALRLEPGQVALDIGANLGWYSLLLARRFPGVEIHAFEPEPRNFALLQRNIEQNGFVDVHPHPLAVADSSGDLSLYPYAKKNMGRHSLLPINDSEPISVRTCRLDDFLEQQSIRPERLGFVKIDIEGFEAQALLGARTMLKSGVPILAEFAPKYIRKGGGDPQQFLGLLRDAGYSPFRCNARSRVAFSAEELGSEERRDILWQRA